jgi:putative endonuclease
MKNYYVYIMTNFTNTVLYTGVTGNLVRRVFEHKSKLVKGFAEKYNVNKLVYFEQCNDSLVAIEREKQIKAGSRKNKFALIVGTNPDFSDLYKNLI